MKTNCLIAELFWWRLLLVVAASSVLRQRALGHLLFQVQRYGVGGTVRHRWVNRWHQQQRHPQLFFHNCSHWPLVLFLLSTWSYVCVMHRLGMDFECRIAVELWVSEEAPAALEDVQGCGAEDDLAARERGKGSRREKPCTRKGSKSRRESSKAITTGPTWRSKTVGNKIKLN